MESIWMTQGKVRLVQGLFPCQEWAGRGPWEIYALSSLLANMLLLFDFQGILRQVNVGCGNCMDVASWP